MPRFYQALVLVFIFVTIFFGSVKSVEAVTIPYQITSGISAIPVVKGSVFFTKQITINFQGGKILLARNPDGTGATKVDDVIGMRVVRENGTLGLFTHRYASTTCSSLGTLGPSWINQFLPGINTVTVTLNDACGGYGGSEPIYLVNISAPDPTPLSTPTPTPTITPQPTVTPSPTPVPFLDLPWDYQSQGKTFTEAAMAMTAFFDHEYPLLSSSVAESTLDSAGTIIPFKGLPRFNGPYSRHDGYDYGKRSGAKINLPVLAAADGDATYVNSCAPCGNAIFIDHHNGYQTRYYHMQAEGLITNISNTPIHVIRGQQIGKIGATGNVSPSGDNGAHIHFMVVEDKNKDGNFSDNIPDGLTDPYGWQSKEEDPWPKFNFDYLGRNRSGNSSFYLWKNQIASTQGTLTPNGGTFETERVKIVFPSQATNEDIKMLLNSTPHTNDNNSLFSIGSTIEVEARNALNNLVTLFQKDFQIIFDFANFDLSSYKVDTMSIYSSQDGYNWQKEETQLDYQTKTATAQVNHLTRFALMAERADTLPPVTTAVMDGDRGIDNWFRSDVRLTLKSEDNEDGLGIYYTMYRILGGGEWEIYKGPLIFSLEGSHQIEFFSVDNDENTEAVQTIEFYIDKTSPTSAIKATPSMIWPPNNKIVNVHILANTLDDNLSKYDVSVVDEYDMVEPKVDLLDQTIQLLANRDGGDFDGREYIIKITAEDMAGNISESETRVLVPHDNDKK